MKKIILGFLLVASTFLGFSVSYAVDQSYPMTVTVINMTGTIIDLAKKDKMDSCLSWVPPTIRIEADPTPTLVILGLPKSKTSEGDCKETYSINSSYSTFNFKWVFNNGAAENTNNIYFNFDSVEYVPNDKPSVIAFRPVTTSNKTGTAIITLYPDGNSSKEKLTI